VKFAFIDAEKASFPISRMCRVLGVSQSGFFAWPDRPACRRQQQDMVFLAHIRTAFALSNGTYGSPRTAYGQELDRIGAIASMSRTGDCYENAPMESFFHTLKVELHHCRWATRDDARRDLFAYIEGYYNRARIHLAIGNITPEQAERTAR
jgi:transposase InsO family protein